MPYSSGGRPATALRPMLAISRPRNVHTSLPSSFWTTRGATSAYSDGTRAVNRSGGSTKWSSTLTRIRSSVRMAKWTSSNACRETADETEGVVGHDATHGVVLEAGQAFDVVAGLGQPLGMGVVRPEQDLGVADDAGEGGDVLLVERGDEHVAAEDLAGLLLQAPADPRPVAAHALHLVHGLHQVGHPEGAVLDAGDAHPWEAAEEVAEDQGRHGVHDWAVPVGGRPLERRLPARGRVGLLAPRHREQLVVPGLRDVEGHGHARLLHPRPEGVEHGVGRGP